MFPRLPECVFCSPHLLKRSLPRTVDVIVVKATGSFQPFWWHWAQGPRVSLSGCDTSEECSREGGYGLIFPPQPRRSDESMRTKPHRSPRDRNKEFLSLVMSCHDLFCNCPLQPTEPTGSPACSGGGESGSTEVRGFFLRSHRSFKSVAKSDNRLQYFLLVSA